MTIRPKVKQAIEKYDLLRDGDRVLVAASGGPDSVALLHLLIDLREEMNLNLEVIHLEHGIRGDEAQRDAMFVAEIADRLALPFHLKKLNLPEMKREKNKGNFEQMGREERYRFFAQTAEERGLDKIATGHTRDDQVETLLMWLLRGSGRAGLGGIPPKRRVAAESGSAELFVIRPLIDISRTEVVNYLTVLSLNYRTDRTNEDPRLLRNWIRLHLLPQLRDRIDSHLDERLARQSELLRDEEAILEELARECAAKVVRGRNVLIGPLLKQREAIQRRILRLWLGETRGNLRSISFDHIENAIHFVRRGPPQGRLSIPGEWELVKQYETLRIQKKKQLRQPACYSYTLEHDGELVVREIGARVSSSRDPSVATLIPVNKLEAVFDIDLLPGPLTVRNFRNGDRFQPLGMNGHKKVKDLFIEKKVPLSVRRTFPLVLAGGDIVWVPGYGRSEIARVRSETREILRVKVVFPDGSFAS